MPGVSRAAVVIGNGAYDEGRLANPVNDAEAIDGELKQLGFETVLGRDLSRDGVFGTMDEFRDKFPTADMSLFFYAGHGLQHQFKNYLVPVDARIRRLADIARFGIDVEQFLEMLEEMASTSIVFLDCCRNNPFFDQIRANTKAEQRDLLPIRPGLARVDLRNGTFIAYATSPDSTADDGGGDHSPFTEALLAHLSRPNESFLDLMIDVTNEVRRITNNRQVPWCQHTLAERVVFNTQEVAPVPTGFMAQEADEAAWLAISASNTISVFDDFIRKYPESRYLGHAQSRISQIQANNEIQQALDGVKLPNNAQVNVVPIRPFDPSNLSPVQPFGVSRKSPSLGHGNMVHPAFLEGLVAISIFSVAKIVIGEGRAIGTAFFVRGADIFGRPDEDLYALTASHVVGAIPGADFAARARDVMLVFEGMNDRGYPIDPLPVAEVVWQSDLLDRGCDASILGFASVLPDFVRPISIARGLPEIDPASPLSFNRPRVITISYPYGGGVRFGSIDNYLLDYDRPTTDERGQPVDEVIKLHHTAASEPGSSGCPILDEQLEVIGIHIGGGDDIPRLNGLDGHYAANVGVWIQSVIQAARR